MAKSTKSNDRARTIFSYAEAFAEAAKKLQPQAKEIQKPTPVADAAKFAPMLTLDAFALELYLKCLHAIDHGKPSKGHDLDALFRALKPGTQQSVRMFYNDRLKTDPLAKQFQKNHPRIAVGLDNALDLAKKTFETTRYLYETEGTRLKLFYWPMIRLAVRDTILIIRPDWKP